MALIAFTDGAKGECFRIYLNRKSYAPPFEIQKRLEVYIQAEIMKGHFTRKRKNLRKMTRGRRNQGTKRRRSKQPS